MSTGSIKAVLVAVKVLLLLAALVAGIGWWYEYTGTPQYSLALLADAVKAKDYETARYFVDDERIADTASKSISDMAIQHMANDMKASENPFSGLGMVAIEMLVPRVRDTAKDNIKAAIRQVLSGDETLTKSAGTQRWDVSRFSQLRIEACVVSGNTAELQIGGILQPNPAQLTEVHLRMARVPNSRNWRIEEIPEIAQVYAKLMESSNPSAQVVTSSSNSSTSPSTPAMTVSKPNRVLELTADHGVCGVDYLNTPVSDGERTLPLRDGKYERRENFESDSVEVKHVFCLDHGVSERALVDTEWMSCGGSCNSSGIVQVFELRDGHPVLVQQIYFDSDAAGTGVSFDDNSLILTVRGRSTEESPHCCAKSLDVVTYRWDEEQLFVQSSYKRVPVPQS